MLDMEEDDKAETRAVIAVLGVEEDDRAETPTVIVSGKRGTGCSPDVMCCCTPPRHIRDVAVKCMANAQPDILPHICKDNEEHEGEEEVHLRDHVRSRLRLLRGPNMHTKGKCILACSAIQLAGFWSNVFQVN